MYLRLRESMNDKNEMFRTLMLNKTIIVISISFSNIHFAGCFKKIIMYLIVSLLMLNSCIYDPHHIKKKTLVNTPLFYIL